MGAWGYGLFQSDHDFDRIAELTDEAGLYALEKEAVDKAKAAGATDKKAGRICYSLYGPSDLELVRKHLDSGVLAKMINEKEALIFVPPEPWPWNDPVYLYVLLGACAMTLGCQLPDSYVVMLKKVYTEGGLMPDALKQMRKALFGPDGYKNGIPYDFESKDLLETANSMDDREQASGAGGFLGMNVMSPGGLFNTGMGNSTTSIVVKELRAKHNNPYACGACGKENDEDGKLLLQCGRCKDRKYCGVECQKKHWNVHKRVCEPVKE